MNIFSWFKKKPVKRKCPCCSKEMANMYDYKCNECSYKLMREHRYSQPLAGTTKICKACGSGKLKRMFIREDAFLVVTCDECECNICIELPLYEKEEKEKFMKEQEKQK